MKIDLTDKIPTIKSVFHEFDVNLQFLS